MAFILFLWLKPLLKHPDKRQISQVLGRIGCEVNLVGTLCSGLKVIFKARYP
ncbi:hypothetical protein AMTR_s00078p00196770 [Amborella trichopoda]|uniref:Uncharacterized protein n=1 Tax=Amborella trichopoda TaxID=13333 RepID=W1P8J0_AMBTC|nr:hypothetical protein AMTR_s00078p00196770 [Amborella trichopoda]